MAVDLTDRLLRRAHAGFEWYPKPQINRRMKMLINRLVYNYRTNRKFMPLFRALRWAWINSTRGA